jgi:hypothetical protein
MITDDYWLAISHRYRVKVRLLAEKHNISTACAFRNIIYNLKHEISHKQNGYFCGYLTGRQIENMIDQVSR